MLSVPAPPTALASTGGALWAASPSANEVTHVDLRYGYFHVVSVGDQPDALAADRRHVWVVNDFDHTISELDASSGGVLRTVSVDSGRVHPQPGGSPSLTPGGIAVDEQGAAWATIQRF